MTHWDDPARFGVQVQGDGTDDGADHASLPKWQSRRLPRELAGDFVTLSGTADPELHEHDGWEFTQTQINVGKYRLNSPAAQTRQPWTEAR